MRWRMELFGCMLAMIVACGVGISVSAYDGNVIYDGNAGAFIFEPGSEYSPTDLFPNFKDVMPGDSLSQKIHIKNDISEHIKINVYMRSLGAQEGSEDFLSKLNLRVEKVTDTELFDAPADRKAQLTDWVYLGTLYSGGQVELNVILDVPVSLDNKDKNMIGYLDWEFMIEELPVEDTDPVPDEPSKPVDEPDTGDTMKLGLYVAAVLCAGALLVLLIIQRRRRKADEEE